MAERLDVRELIQRSEVRGQRIISQNAPPEFERVKSKFGVYD